MQSNVKLIVLCCVPLQMDFTLHFIVHLCIEELQIPSSPSPSFPSASSVSSFCKPQILRKLESLQMQLAAITNELKAIQQILLNEEMPQAPNADADIMMCPSSQASKYIQMYHKKPHTYGRLCTSALL